jgi:hypothetical protein
MCITPCTLKLLSACADRPAHETVLRPLPTSLPKQYVYRPGEGAVTLHVPCDSPMFLKTWTLPGPTTWG